MELLMHTRRQIIALGGISLVVFAGVPLSAFASNAEPLAVVVAKQGPLEALSLAELKRLFMGESIVGPKGQKLIALNRDSKSDERIGFDRSVLGMSPDAAARYWIDRKIRGQSSAPKAIEPAAVLQRVVAKLHGAVGYVRARDVSADVTIVRVDGKRPGDAGYPIVTAGPSTAQAAASFSWA
jgi:hypothetical protein